MILVTQQPDAHLPAATAHVMPCIMMVAFSEASCNSQPNIRGERHHSFLHRCILHTCPLITRLCVTRCPQASQRGVELKPTRSVQPPGDANLLLGSSDADTSHDPEARAYLVASQFYTAATSCQVDGASDAKAAGMQGTASSMRPPHNPPALRPLSPTAVGNSNPGSCSTSAPLPKLQGLPVQDLDFPILSSFLIDVYTPGDPDSQLQYMYGSHIQATASQASQSGQTTLGDCTFSSVCPRASQCGVLGQASSSLRCSVSGSGSVGGASAGTPSVPGPPAQHALSSHSRAARAPQSAMVYPPRPAPRDLQSPPSRMVLLRSNTGASGHPAAGALPLAPQHLAAVSRQHRHSSTGAERSDKFQLSVAPMLQVSLLPTCCMLRRHHAHASHIGLTDAIHIVTTSHLACASTVRVKRQPGKAPGLHHCLQQHIRVLVWCRLA